MTCLYSGVMTRVRRSFRFEESLADRYEAAARELGQTATLFVVRALEAALGQRRAAAIPGAGQGGDRETPVDVPDATASPRASANFGAVGDPGGEHPVQPRYGPRRPRGKPFDPRAQS